MLEESSAQDRALSSHNRRRGWWMLAIALAMGFAVIWASPSFETQDGPAHLYNAHVLNETLRPHSPFQAFFTVKWSPLPNWLGHLMGMALVATLPLKAASLVATTIPLLGIACSTFWLKRRVSGCRGDLSAALFTAALSLNVCWLFGFTSFLLGGCLFSLTLGYWWCYRAQFGPGRAAGIAAFVILGYFAHVVSLGLTVLGLMVLAIATPGPRWRSRLGWTCVGIVPLFVLLPVYRNLMKQGGPLEPRWGHLKDLGSLDSWREHLGWIDPITLGRKGAFPFVAGESYWLGFVTPVTLLLAAVFLLATRGILENRERRGWAILSAILLLGGLASPDTLGPAHGNYLPQRIVLFGLITTSTWLDFSAKRPIGKLSLLLLSAAVSIQSFTVLDYSRESSERVGPFHRMRSRIGRNHRIGTLLIGIKGRFRSNPLLHADNLVGIGTGNVIWFDYETCHYYFPVQFRPDIHRPPACQFEDIALMDDAKDADLRAALWLELLEEHNAEIDILLVWGNDPRLAKINARWFDLEPLDSDGPLRALKHR